MKKLVAAVLTGVMVLSAAACGAKEFDAKGYVQGMLDAQFKGEYAAHAEDTGEDEETVKKQIEDENRSDMETIVKMMGLNPTEEELQECVDWITEGFKKIEYEVQDAVKDENDNYTVDVVVTPIGLLDNVNEILAEKIQGENAVDVSEYMTAFNEAIKESIDQAQTFEKETVTLNVTFTEEGKNRIYSVNEADLTELVTIATHQQ